MDMSGIYVEKDEPATPHLDRLNAAMDRLAAAVDDRIDGAWAEAPFESLCLLINSILSVTQLVDADETAAVRQMMADAEFAAAARAELLSLPERGKFGYMPPR